MISKALGRIFEASLPGAIVRHLGRYASTMPHGNFESLGNTVVGESGRQYLIEHILQQRDNPPHRVCLARSAKDEKFVLKDVRPNQLKYIQGIYRSLSENQYLRLSEDVVPDRSILVYRYLRDHLLSFAQQDLPDPIRKRILRDTLRGIAALHERNIVHTDIKPNNILVNWGIRDDGISVRQVQLADLEDATYVDSHSDIVGVQVGNQMWRSPESHTQARVNKPSDIFSFGIVCIYVMTKRVIFAVQEGDLEEGEEPLALILERQISYFADEEGMDAFLRYLDNSPWCQVLEVLRAGFNGANPRRPVSLWTGIDDDLKDLLIGLTRFDPVKRLTAEEALEHRWFRDIDQEPLIL